MHSPRARLKAAPKAKVVSSRRSFLLSAASAAAGGCIALSTSGCKERSDHDRQLVFASLDDALRELDRLTTAYALQPAATWTWPQTLLHCAQSIEYSMSGFPQPSSALFQRTAGALAFNVFSWRGRMSHDLNQAIPGAPSLDADAAGAAAVARLRQAVRSFQDATGALRPHFAYGELSKSEYGQAHAMHMANHLSAFDLKAA